MNDSVITANKMDKKLYEKAKARGVRPERHFVARYVAA
jgi:hypothetical protein